MDKIVLSDSPNWIITSFVNGSFGFVFGRCLATSPDIRWYDFHYNGSTPWDWNHFPPNIGFGNSPAHFFPWFDISNGRQSVPWFGRYQQWDNEATSERFQQPWLIDILKDKKLVYQSHDDPDYLRSRFPNAKIILLDVHSDDILAVAKNHLDKTGSYPAFVDHGQYIDPKMKEWSGKTTFGLLRDWEQYNLNLTTKEWVYHHVSEIKKDIAVKKSKSEFADIVFSTKDRQDVESLVKLHEQLGIRYNLQGIAQVLESFNLDFLIKNAS